jgi:hypothetical protein
MSMAQGHDADDGGLLRLAIELANVAGTEAHVRKAVMELGVMAVLKVG